MITFIHKFTLCLTAWLLACVTGHAYEQDNWYLAWEATDIGNNGVAYYEDDSTGIGQIYKLTYWGYDSNISVYDLNGSLDRYITIASTRYEATDLALDNDGNIYLTERYAATCLANDGTFKWRKGKSASSTNHGSNGAGDGEFNYARGISIGPDGNLYVADMSNHRVQVLDKNGTFIRKFGEYGSAPGQLNSPLDLIFLPDGRLIVADYNHLNYFDSNGTFINRNTSGNKYVSVSPSNTIWSLSKLMDAEGVSIAYQSSVYHESRTAFTPDGDLIESRGNLRLWKRAYRTKGLPERNVIPQPAIRNVTQRAGTNVLDVDFEIIDSDDANATIGIIAYCGNDKVVPQTWVDGTANKIGTPITTNEVHRVSWDVKQDWNTSTGTIKFEILCQDGRTNKPVDLHFLTLPFSDGNMTISRSPLKDSDFQNYAKYLLAKGDAQFESESTNEAVLAADSNATELFVFTNCGNTGRIGPTEAQIQSEYNGTNLQGLVSTGWKDGYQKWTVPVTGEYWIEAVGAAGGANAGLPGGMGAFIRGKFYLVSGQELNILVGQKGSTNSYIYNRGASGGGGTFVVADSNDTPLVIAGGGGGAGMNQAVYHHASVFNNGNNGFHNGGSNGSGGLGNSGGGGGGFTGSGSGSGGGGKSYQLGGGGGDSPHSGLDGGFGGGGATRYSNDESPGGGGGFSGGGGSQNSNPQIAGGGGSYNSGSSQTNIIGFGGGHGLVRIYSANGVVPTFPSVTITDRSHRPLGVYAKLLIDLGPGYRFATANEVTKAREAATPGAVNSWTASAQVKPRNLPGKVNEYGFDVSTTDGYWVIKE